MANSAPSSYPRYPKSHSKREKKLLETALAAAAADASDAAFTPAVTADWPVQPTTIADALNKLAARLNVLEP